jgi:hypothetical protein
MTLPDDMKTAGRDNTFNLLRMMAAPCALVSHSYALAIGNGELEPFKTSLGLSVSMYNRLGDDSPIRAVVDFHRVEGALFRTDRLSQAATCGT